jgi:hypothetical protein
LGNEERLKKDLADLGVFDESMSLYLLYKIRSCSAVGFSGFEGRYYSLFESLEHDLSEAAGLQALVTAFAFKCLVAGAVTHAHIPDDPTVESERRQIFFGAAVDVPAFYVRQDTSNIFMRKILARTRGTRSSRRYPGYVRAENREYRKALVSILRNEADDLIEMLDLHETMKCLHERLSPGSGQSVVEKLLRSILQEAGAKSPFSLSAEEFNGAAEQFYRETLRKRHLEEGFDYLAKDLRRSESNKMRLVEAGCVMEHGLESSGVPRFLSRAKREVMDGEAGLSTITALIRLIIFSVMEDMESQAQDRREPVIA